VGLESVEMLLQAEETFGIRIPDKAAENVKTPADLVALVLSRIPMTDLPGCTSQSLFYRLRKGLQVQLPALVVRFSPNTQLLAMLHKKQWQKIWPAVRETIGDACLPAVLPLPGLFCDGPKTIKELIYYLVTASPKPNVAAGEFWNRTRVEAEVRKIVVSIFGEKNYRRSARFVEDLGMS
jgi:hypothetical protein